MKIFKLFILCVTVRFFVFPCFAGENFFRNKSIVSAYHYGYVWAHRERVEHLTTGHTQGIELSFLTQTDGSKWWQSVHNYPQTGFSIMYFDLANPKVIGNATAVIGFINFPLKRSQKFLFTFQAGAGLGYLTKRFTTNLDHKNMAIGSHLNSTIRVNLKTSYRIFENIFFHLNYGITHFSNAAFRLPNLGINNVSLSAGLSYAFSKQNKFLTPVIPAADKRLITEIVYGAGVKENYPPDGKQYFAHTLYIQLLKALSHKSKLAFGLDGFYDLSLSRFVKDASSQEDKKLKLIRSGFHAGYEMQINRFTLVVHMGYYILDQTHIDGNFYHRYGLKYSPGKRLFLNLSLKSHWARADYAELGIGWRFRP